MTDVKLAIQPVSNYANVKDCKKDEKGAAIEIKIDHPKLVILYHALSVDELHTFNKYVGAAIDYKPPKSSSLIQTFDELLSKYDVICINALDKDCFRYFASYSTVLKANPAVKIIYSADAGYAMPKENVDAISKFADAIIKGIPSEFNDKNDFIGKLLSSHIPKIPVNRIKSFLFRTVRSWFCS